MTHNNEGTKILYKINRRPSQRKKQFCAFTEQIKRRKREKSSVRTKVENVFSAVKGLFGYRKTCYKGRRR